jgi:hypothetical protein
MFSLQMMLRFLRDPLERLALDVFDKWVFADHVRLNVPIAGLNKATL